MNFLIFLLGGIVGLLLAVLPDPVRSAHSFWKTEDRFTIYLIIRTLMRVSELVKMILVFLYVYAVLPLLAYGSIRFGSPKAVVYTGWLLVVLITLATLHVLAERYHYYVGMIIRSKGATMPTTSWWHCADVTYRAAISAGAVLFLYLSAVAL